MNHAPIAAAGADQSVTIGSRIALDGSSSSDPDGNLLTYRWSFEARPPGSMAVLSNAGAVQPTFTADVAGTYTVDLVVNDGVVDSDVDAMVVTAASDNAAPVADAGADQRIITGEIVTLDGSASSDANGDLLTYRWSFTTLPASTSTTLSDPTSARPRFTADRDGTYVIELVVEDGQMESAPDWVTVTATHANAAPVANAGPDQHVVTGSLVTLDGSESRDANDDLLTYEWAVVTRPLASTATLSTSTSVRPTFRADVDGDYVFRLVVNDGEANSDPDTVTVTAATPNAVPVANAGPDQNVTAGSVVALDGSASSDADGDTLTYQWAFSSKPPGSAAVLTSTVVVSPMFTADLPGTYVLRLVVNDGKANSEPDTVTVTAAAQNSAPVANAGSDQSVATNSVVTLDGSASSDADGDPLTYQWTFSSMPPGSAATLSSATAATPTFTADLPGAYVLRLVVNDGEANSEPDTVTVTAATPNTAPIAVVGPDQNVTTGALVTLDGSASSDADLDPLTYQWAFVSKPAGSTAVLSNATASQPTFTADAAGKYVISLVVNDGRLDSVPVNASVTATLPPDTENSDRLFDLTQTQVPTFDIEVAPADWEWLNANALLEEYVPATLVFEGRRIENIGLRFKGSYNTLTTCFDAAGNRICSKLSIKLKFNEYVKATRFKTLRKLNFNSSIRDPTFLHEVITYYLFRAIGVPAPRASFALINVNGEPQGLFVMVEEVDDEFIKSHWSTATGGNLYKSIWPQYTDPAPYIATLENNTTAPNVSRMLALTQTAQTCTDETFPAAASTQLDLPSIAKYLAVDRAVYADDGVQVFYCSDPTTADCVNNNYYWYEVPNGPSELIPWDVDYTLADVNYDLGRSNWDSSAEACVPVPYCDYMVNELNCNPADHSEWILRPQCNQLLGLMHRATWNDYRLALRQLADGPMSDANIGPIMDFQTAKIDALVTADTHGPGHKKWANNVDWMRTVLVEQVKQIEVLLGEP